MAQGHVPVVGDMTGFQRQPMDSVCSASCLWLPCLYHFRVVGLQLPHRAVLSTQRRRVCSGPGYTQVWRGSPIGMEEDRGLYHELRIFFVLLQGCLSLPED